MSRFGKKQEDQLAYKCEKIEKYNQELIEKYNELVAVKNDLSTQNNILIRSLAEVVKKTGGTVTIDDDSINFTNVQINVTKDPELKTTTFTYLEKPKVEEEPTNAG